MKLWGFETAYLCEISQQRFQIKDQEVVDESRAIVLIIKALLSTLQGSRHQFIPCRIFSWGPPTAP